MIKHRQKILINANIEKSWHFLSDLQRSLIFDKYYTLIEIPSNYSVNSNLEFKIHTKYLYKKNIMKSQILNSCSPNKLKLKCYTDDTFAFNHIKSFDLKIKSNKTELVYLFEGSFNYTLLNYLYYFPMKVAVNLELKYLKKAIESSDSHIESKHLYSMIK